MQEEEMKPLTYTEYYIDGRTQPTNWVAPFVHPSECDHEVDPEVKGALCSQCCPCDLCGLDRSGNPTS